MWLSKVPGTLVGRSVADLVYLGGHTGGRGQGKWSGSPGAGDAEVSPRQNDSPRYVVPSTHWPRPGGKQEVEWLILVACWGMETGGAEKAWVEEMRRLGIRGMLSFNGQGWSGRREGLAFLKLAAEPSWGELEAPVVAGSKELRLKAHPQAADAPQHKRDFECSEILSDALIKGAGGFNRPTEHRDPYNPPKEGPYTEHHVYAIHTFALWDRMKLGAETTEPIVGIHVADRTITLAAPLTGRHGAGTKIESVTPPSLSRAWAVTWGGVARYKACERHFGPLGFAYLVYQCALDDSLTNPPDEDPVGGIVYRAIQGKGSSMPAPPHTWEGTHHLH